MNKDPAHAPVLRHLLEIGRALTSETTLDAVLSRILDGAIQVTGAERAFLALVGDDGLQVVAARNLDHEEVQNARRKLSHSVIRRVLESGEPMVSVDAHVDPRLEDSQSVVDMRIKSVACIPLKLGPMPTTPVEISAPAVIGCIYLDHRYHTGQFAEEALDTLELFGVYAALAVQAARLLDTLQQRNESLNLELADSVTQLTQTRRLLENALRDSTQRHEVPGVVYASRAMHEILGLLRRVADNDLPIQITGETGTGKEMLARAVHHVSLRTMGPFVAVNCGAIPSELFESELFGHVRGAFTGADRDRTGLIEAADKGTLFLDEVADLPLHHQVKLLRVLQEGEVRPVGASRSHRVDVRILSATNKDLDAEVKEGRFREDLFYRLRVFHVHVPPLRDRPEDVPLIVDRLIEHQTGRQPQRADAKDGDTTAPPGIVIDPEVYALLSNYTWPGNVRELENEVRRALALSSGRLTVNELSPAVFNAPTRPGRLPKVGGGETLDEIIAAVERQVIVEALERLDGNKSRTAQELGISRNGLALKMERLEIT